MRILIILAGIALASCGTGQPYTERFFLKQGVSYDRYQRDALVCANTATQAAPNAPQIGWMPYVGIYSVDQNAGLRQANLDVCMRDKGYALTEIPQCLPDRWDEVRTTGFGRREDLNQRLNIQPNSCFLRVQNEALFSA